MGTVTTTDYRYIPLPGSRIMVLFTLTCSSTYANSGTPTNTGDTISAQSITDLSGSNGDLTKVKALGPLGPSGKGRGYFFDRTHAKVRAFNGATEVALNTDLSDDPVECFAIFEDASKHDF